MTKYGGTPFMGAAKRGKMGKTLIESLLYIVFSVVCVLMIVTFGPMIAPNLYTGGTMDFVMNILFGCIAVGLVNIIFWQHQRSIRTRAEKYSRRWQ